eukprot:9485880-Pyramimonas_sp.AAC.1
MRRRDPPTPSTLTPVEGPLHSTWLRCRGIMSVPILVMVHLGRRRFAGIIYNQTRTKIDHDQHRHDVATLSLGQ